MLTQSSTGRLAGSLIGFYHRSLKFVAITRILLSLLLLLLLLLLFICFIYYAIVHGVQK